ncbi:MAG: plasmid recombination protein [Clostridia bacterium]|nr:plasmid recombination protein [Clostridia bacterium]
MHIEKYNRNAVGHMLEHYERHPQIYKTQNHISPELKERNYRLGYDELTGFAKYKKILATPGLKILNRADVNTMVDIVLTLPKAEHFPQERAKEFFEVGYKFLLSKFCGGKEEFLISCYAHLDESQDGEIKGQPHIHFAFAPIVEHNGKLKVCAAKVVNRELLKMLHKEASDYFYNHFGFDVGIINGATKEGNLTIPQLREQTKKYNELVKTNAKLKNENEQLKFELSHNMHNLKVWQLEEDITPTFELQK